MTVRYRVHPHTAHLTGAFWFVVKGPNGIIEHDGVRFWDDRENAQEVADELNRQEVNNGDAD